jgi:hypothetical protein
VRSMRLSPARLASWLGFGVALGVACTSPSTTPMDTDATSESGGCVVGSDGCPCFPGGMCDGGLVCASKICVPLEDTTEGTDTVEPTTSSTVGECAPADEHESAQCPADEPYCSKTGECVTCSGISCASIDPAKPACDDASGRCVACTADDASGCGGATPVCDVEGQTCRACVEHDECSGGACDLATGACFPAADALWVATGGSCDDAGPGSEAAPLCTISEAMSRVVADQPRAILVRGGVYPDLLAVPAGGVVAVVRVGAEPVAITGLGGYSVAINAGARVYFDGVEIRGNTLGSGIGCDTSEVWIDRSLVRQHNVSGVSASGCSIQVRSSVITKNLGEGVFVSGGGIRIENSFLTDNGDKNKADNPRGGVALAGGAAAELVYTTLVGNNAYTGGGLSVECDPDPGDESVTIRNSIAFNAVGYITFNCEGVEVVTNSAFSAASDDPEDDNLGVTTDEAPTLVAADPKLVGVYRPTPGSKLAGVGRFADGDPERDFEGDPRPTEDASFPGADQPK